MVYQQRYNGSWSVWRTYTNHLTLLYSLPYYNCPYCLLRARNVSVWQHAGTGNWNFSCLTEKLRAIFTLCVCTVWGQDMSTTTLWLCKLIEFPCTTGGNTIIASTKPSRVIQVQNTRYKWHYMYFIVLLGGAWSVGWQLSNLWLYICGHLPTHNWEQP